MVGKLIRLTSVSGLVETMFGERYWFDDRDLLDQQAQVGMTVVFEDVTPNNSKGKVAGYVEVATEAFLRYHCLLGGTSFPVSSPSNS